MSDLLQSFVADPKKQFVDDAKSVATDQTPRFEQRGEPRFIQSNKEFSRDLIMAIHNFGTKGSMDGQTITYRPRGVAGDKGPLMRELMAWKDNANRIVMKNAEAIREGIIDAVRLEVFSTTPGPSLPQQLIATTVESAIGVALGLLLPPGVGEGLGLMIGLIKDIVIDAMTAEDMAEREQLFVSAMRQSSDLTSITNHIYNLDTVLSYYQSWLENSSDTPVDFLRFRIPFTPEAMNKQTVATSVASKIRERKNTAIAEGKAVQQAEALDITKLYRFLQEQGISADAPALEQALGGRAGLGLIREIAKFPGERFEPPIAPESLYPFDRIFVYIFPAAARWQTQNVPKDVALDLAKRFGRDESIIALLLEKAGAHALYNARTQSWISG